MIEINTNLKRKIIISKENDIYTVKIKQWDESEGEFTNQIHVQKGEGVILSKNVITYAVYHNYGTTSSTVVEHFTTSKIKIRDFDGVIMIEGIK